MSCLCSDPTAPGHKHNRCAYDGGVMHTESGAAAKYMLAYNTVAAQRDRLRAERDEALTEVARLRELENGRCVGCGKPFIESVNQIPSVETLDERKPR